MGFILEKIAVEILIQRNRAKFPNDEIAFRKQCLQDALEIMKAWDGPAKQCLEHFFSKTGSFWEFQPLTLTAEDTGVKDRLYSEMVRRSLGLLTLREQEEARQKESNQGRYPTGQFIQGTSTKSSNFTVPGTGVVKPEILSKKIQDYYVDPVITIFQHNFSSPMWWAALGSFGFEYKIVDFTKEWDRIFVRISGENEYRWWPDENRSTKELHKMASELIEKGAAKTFTMRAKPTIFVVNANSKQIEEAKMNPVIDSTVQTNPNNSASRPASYKTFFDKVF